MQSRTILTVAVVASMLLVGFVVFVPGEAAADSRTWTSDTDWLSGTLDPNLVLVGTGPGSYLELRRSDFPDWMQMDPGTVPPARDGYCLAWIEVDNSFLMFGGFGLSNLLGDTWKYNFTNDQWTLINTPTAPSNRTTAGCAYDPVEEVVVLHGGLDASFVWSTETWEFDGNTNQWAQIPPSGGPRNLETTPLTYDSRQQKILMLGRNSVNLLMETWEYDAGANTWTNRNPSAHPDLRDGHNMAYDALADRTLLFSGGEGLTLYCDFWLYAYTQNTWSKVRDCIPNEDPNARTGHGMTYRESYSAVMMFGGYDSQGYPPETWVYLSPIADWYNPLVTATPGGRRNVHLADSWIDDAMLTFGGDKGGLFNDTWAFARGYVVNLDAPWTSSTVPEDTTCDNPNYDRIFWNSTTNPPGAILRYQIATSSDPAGPWTFRGPGGFPGAHYTTSGTLIDPIHDNQRYFRVIAKLKTTNGRVTPQLEDLTITFSCPPTPPYVRDTNPSAGQTTHPINAPIWVNFSEPMNTGTVQWTFSDPSVTLAPSWSNGNQTLLLTPDRTLRDCTGYTVEITQGRDVNDDLSLVPGPVQNPWSFTTVCINPYIVSTDPPDGALDIPVDKTITVLFNEPMNTTTVTWSITGGIALTASWSPARDTLNLSHTTPFVDCTTYTVEILSGQDDQGLSLVAGPAANPWSFFTFCQNPYIVSTDPPDGAIDVPLAADIIVVFSKTMDPTSVTWLFSDPGITFTSSWNAPTNDNLTLSHATPFAELQAYTMNITGGTDLAGRPLVPGPVALNPWSFTTIGINPFITSTAPADGATGVALDAGIVIQFSEPMNITTVTWLFSDPGISFAASWNSPTNDRLTLNHTTPYVECTQYTMRVTNGEDLVGLPLGPGPVPNPWSFRVACPLQAPAGLVVVRLPPDSIFLDWSDVLGATGYRVYTATDRFAPFPGGWASFTTAVSQYVVPAHLSDGIDHYYIVRATNGVDEGPNSSMGAKAVLTFSYSTTNTNIAWFSLPYNSIYARASDIANELGSGNIDVVGKWDASRQSSVVYYFARGRWRGTNFAIAPGDGLFLGTRMAFSWVVTGTDADVSLSFTLNAPPRGNVNWISVPYTGVYASASDIANELGSGQIVEVGLWDAATQTAIRWYWDGSTWTGTDFAIAPGDGLYVIIASSFTWNPVLITPTVP